MLGLQDFIKKYGFFMSRARREGQYGFPMSRPKALKNDPMGQRAIERAFKIGRQEYKRGKN